MGTWGNNSPKSLRCHHKEQVEVNVSDHTSRVNLTLGEKSSRPRITLRYWGANSISGLDPPFTQTKPRSNLVS
ncbi:hypothetical protein PanWU01x14_107380 [Parasponia andersonii]|uniref:Uncharacterized protein n=1 Tax=Parasponia andersonii TaxID=3476 RepID=A0A2P5D094_PARAD|nr:hypothetical protein PanWU01x14_107380 [Parasponia andersonii]